MIYKNEYLPFLNQLLVKIKTMNFSIQTQYKFLKILKAVNEELIIYEEQRNSLIESYAEFDNGNPVINENGGIKIKEGCLEDCKKKIDEINAMQIALPDIYFSLDELEPLGLTLGELELLEPFIK